MPLEAGVSAGERNGGMKQRPLFDDLRDCIDARLEILKQHGGDGYWKERERVQGLFEKMYVLRKACVAADSELSAIAHGRPPSTKNELLLISAVLREAYEGGR